MFLTNKHAHTAASSCPHALSINSSMSKHSFSNVTGGIYSHFEMCIRKLWIMRSTAVTLLARGAHHIKLTILAAEYFKRMLQIAS